MVGLWPKTEEIFQDKLKCNLYVLVVLLMLVIVGVIPCILSLLKIQKNFMLMAEHIQFILPLVSSITRLIIFWWKKEALIPIVNVIIEDWLKSKNIQEKNMMITWAQRARTVIIVAYSIMGMSFVAVVFLPAFGISVTYTTNATNTKKLLPLLSYYIYDMTKMPIFVLTYIGQIITLFFATMIYTGIDNFLGLLVFHICGQMDILTARITCITIAVIEDTYNKILLALFLYFGIVFAFFAFLLISLVEERSYVSITRILYFVSNLINIFVHMALYCAVGEILVSQCDKVYYAICNQEWYFLDSKNAKDLIFLMIRTNIPSYITAGKIFPLTIATFCNLIKTSVSYVSIMLTIKN